MPYECDLTVLHSQPTLVIHATTPVDFLQKTLDKGFAGIMAYLQQLQQAPAGPPFTIYYNTDAENLEIEFGFPVFQEIPGRYNIKSSETPSGEALICLYTGSYNSIDSVYDAMTHWIKDTSYELMPLVYEMYLNYPEKSPQALKTQIAIPLKEHIQQIEEAQVLSQQSA